MKIFLSFDASNIEIAIGTAQALQAGHVQVVMDTLKLTRDERAQTEFGEILTALDAFVFLLGDHGVNDRKLESEWRSLLRIQWDSDDMKPMIPLLAGVRALPPFLRNRRPIAVELPHPDYRAIAQTIIRAIQQPFLNDDKEGSALEVAAQRESHAELRRMAEALDTIPG